VVSEERISRFLSFLLRHNPKEYSLPFDRQGFVAWSQLLTKVQERFSQVTEDQLVAVIEGSDKKRFRLVDGKVRATYGHSFPVELDLEPIDPPPRLYHGTARDLARNFLREGLKPRDRRHIYLSASMDDALAVGKRRDPFPAVLIVDSQAAHARGVQFFSSGHLFLAEQIPPSFLTLWEGSEN
jgi:putative RNA 2'-phosphotransferase